LFGRVDLAVAQHLPRGRHQAGDRHLKFHEDWDNLPGQGEPASLVITEWLRPFPRALVICDETGAALTSGDAGIQAPGFSFTAYLRWKGFRDHAHDVALPEADPVVDHLLDVARAQMRKHFQARISERRAAVLDAWREEGSYPYAEPAGDVLGIAEQQMFDVVAVAAEPTLRQSDRSSRRLSLALIRSALRNNPEGLSEVLSQVLSRGCPGPRGT